MRTHNVTVLLVEYNNSNALMVWSLTLSVVLFRFRGLNVVVVGVLVCLLVDITKCRAYFTLTFLYCRLLCDLPHVLLSSPWVSFAPRWLLCTLQLQPCRLPEFYFIGFSLQCCHWVTCQIWLQEVQFTTCLYLHGDRYLGPKLPCSATPLMHIP